MMLAVDSKIYLHVSSLIYVIHKYKNLFIITQYIVSINNRDVYRMCVVAYNNVYSKLFNIKSGMSISMEYVTNLIDSLNVIIRKTAYSFRLFRVR